MTTSCRASAALTRPAEVSSYVRLHLQPRRRIDSCRADRRRRGQVPGVGRGRPDVADLLPGPQGRLRRRRGVDVLLHLPQADASGNVKLDSANNGSGTTTTMTDGKCLFY
jgi:hypothetical protein